MVVGWGRSVPEGSLPVYSTDTEEEAHDLVVGACAKDGSGQYYSQELARDQTFENLGLFSAKLEMIARLSRKAGEES